MEAMIYLCFSFLYSYSLPSAYLISYTRIFLGWISVLFYCLRQHLTKQMGEKAIYKCTKGTEDFHAFHIVSVTRTQSIPVWIKTIIFLISPPVNSKIDIREEADDNTAVLCILLFCKLVHFILSSFPSCNQYWNPPSSYSKGDSC